MTAEPPERKTETVRSWERGLGGEARSTSAGDLLTASITKSKKKKKYGVLLSKCIHIRHELLPLRPLWFPLWLREIIIN